MSSLELLLAVFPSSAEVLRLHAVVGGQSTPDPDKNDKSRSQKPLAFMCLRDPVSRHIGSDHV